MDRMLDRFAAKIEKDHNLDNPDVRAVLAEPEDRLAAAAIEVADCREALNAPEFGNDEAPTEGEIAFTEDLADELSGKRFPELPGLLYEFAFGLRQLPWVAERCQITPELCEETMRQEAALGSITAAADRIYTDAKDMWMIFYSTGVGLCQQVLGGARRSLTPAFTWDPAPPCEPADLQDTLSGQAGREITPGDPMGRTRTVLGQLVRAFFKVLGPQAGTRVLHEEDHPR